MDQDNSNLYDLEKMAGVSRLTAETNTTNEKGTMELREVLKKGELETIYMREIEQRSRISEEKNSITSLLVNHLHFDGMNQYGNSILLGQAADTSHLEIHTKRYLQEIAPLTNSHPYQAPPISLEECIK